MMPSSCFDPRCCWNINSIMMYFRCKGSELVKGKWKILTHCSIQWTCYAFLLPQVIHTYLFHSLLGSREALSNLICNQIEEKNNYLCSIASETVFCMHLTWRTLPLLLKTSDTVLLHEVDLTGKDTLLNSSSPLLEKMKLIFHIVSGVVISFLWITVHIATEAWNRMNISFVPVFLNWSPSLHSNICSLGKTICFSILIWKSYWHKLTATSDSASWMHFPVFRLSARKKNLKVFPVNQMLSHLNSHHF